MYMRKIAAAACFATGAALAFAPLAAALPDPTLVTDTLNSEIGSLNSSFETYAALGGVTDVVKGGPGVFDSFGNVATDAPQATTFGDVTPIESSLYGANPILAGISSDTGPYSEFNGAVVQFDNAYNVFLYAAQNNGALDTNVGDYIENNAINHALTLGNATAAEQYLINFGVGDLNGYYGNFAPASTGVGDILPTQASEITQLNSLFELDGRLADAFGDIAPHAAVGTNVGFDTIATTDLNSTFDSLVFGAAGASGDPGSYDVLNGALTEFFNADNVGLFSLLNGGDLLSSDLIFGTHDFVSGAGDTVSSAITDYLNLGFSDLAGYFTAAMGM